MHHAEVSKRKHGLSASIQAATSQPTFLDAAAADIDAAASKAPVVGMHEDHLHSPDGDIYRLVARRVSPDRAQELLTSGAMVVVDDCGCGGYCGLFWPAETERTALAARRPQLKKNRFGWLDEWANEAGTSLLFVNGDVRWT